MNSNHEKGKNALIDNAIINNEFYNLTHNNPSLKNGIKERFEGISKAFEILDK